MPEPDFDQDEDVEFLMLARQAKKLGARVNLVTYQDDLITRRVITISYNTTSQIARTL